MWKANKLLVLLFLSAIFAAVSPNPAAHANVTVTESEMSVFVDLCPIQTYDYNGRLYVEAGSLLNYGFTKISENDSAFCLLFDEKKDFIPLPVSVINRKKSDIKQSPNVIQLSETSKKVYLNDKAYSAYKSESEQSLFIPLDGLLKYGTIEKDAASSKITLTLNRSAITSGDDKESPLTGRAIFINENIRQVTPGYINPFYMPYIEICNYSYLNGKLSGFCVYSDYDEYNKKGIRDEGIYKNGVKDGKWRESVTDGEYIYGYRVVWDGNYQRGEKVLQKENSGLSFVKVYCGSYFAIFEKSDGTLYGLGDNTPYWNYTLPMMLEKPLSEYGYFIDTQPKSSSYSLSKQGQFTIRSTGELLIDQVIFVLQFSQYRNGYDSDRTLFIRKDNTLWYSRLNDFGGHTSWNDAKDLSKPVKIMDNVISCGITGSCAYFAIKKDGSLWHFGNNSFGEAGNGTTSDTFSDDTTTFKPVKVMDNVKKVAGGNGNVMALTNDGELYCWANNDYGQTGSGGTENVTKPLKVLEGVSDIGSSWSCTYAVKKDGTIWAAGIISGTNKEGQKNTVYKQIENFYYTSIER